MTPCSLLVAALLTANPNVKYVPQPVRLIEVQMTVYQGDPLDAADEGRLKILAAPKLITRSGTDCGIQFGCQYRVGDFYIPFGTTMMIHTDIQADGKIRVAVNSKHQKNLDQSAGNVNYLQSEVRDTRFVNDGQTYALRIDADSPSQQTWARIRISTDVTEQP